MSDSESEPELDLESPDNYLDCQWLPREEIEPNDWNPNVIDHEEQKMLKQSIENNGWTRPIVVHASELYIIDGEQRWTVAEHTQLAENDALTPPDVPAGHVPVFGIGISEDEAKVSTIQHNRARGFVDYNSLYDYFEEFQDDGMLDSLADELDFEEDDLLRIVDNESVASAISEGHELSKPWEPRDIRDLDEKEVETTTRTKAMSDASSTDDGEGIDRVSMVFSPAEKQKIEAVFDAEDTAETLMTYIRYLDENEMVEDFRTAVGLDASEEHPHPETIDYSDE